MGINTWNFPCWQTQDDGPTSVNPRQTGGTTHMVGPGATFATNHDAFPFINNMTIIGAFFDRTGWTSQDGAVQTLWSIGTLGAASPAIAMFLVGAYPNRALEILVWDGVGATTRYDYLLGDENGVDWLTPDKWFQYAISVTTTGIQFAVNGSTSPTQTAVTEVVGSLNLDNGTERLWLFSVRANINSNDPIGFTTEWPSVVIGPCAMSEIALDLSDSVVLDRIFDSSGDLKNPGEDGSLWFGSYASNIPHFWLHDGSGRNPLGSGSGWGVKDGGIAGMAGQSGGLRKQYEQQRPFRMMTYDGSSGYYSDTFTSSGNKVTFVTRFNRESFTGNAFEYLSVCLGPSGGAGNPRAYMAMYSSDYATAERQSKLFVTIQNNAGAKICRLLTDVDVTDGTDKVVFLAFDGDAGTALLYINGVDADDAGFSVRTVTTGTLDSGASSDLWYGDWGTIGEFFTGEIGYCGYRDAYLTNPTDFYHPTNGLQVIDQTTWAEWGAQPLVWSSDGKLETNNAGSIGVMTKNGTVTGPS